MQQSLVIVLPMHNQQRTLCSTVHEVLELAEVSHGQINVVVVDDGSTDDTYETACEMARVYPQLTVLRQRTRQGLRSVLELVRNRTQSELVLMHDGVSAFNQVELKHLIAASSRQGEQHFQSAGEMDNCGSRRTPSVRSLHDRLEQAHHSISGFCWLRLEKPLIPRRRSTGVENRRSDSPDSGRPDSGRPDSGRPDSGRPDSGRTVRTSVAPVLANLPAGVQPLSLQ